jgi:hypothetical protein
MRRSLTFPPLLYRRQRKADDFGFPQLGKIPFRWILVKFTLTLWATVPSQRSITMGRFDEARFALEAMSGGKNTPAF